MQGPCQFKNILIFQYRVRAIVIIAREFPRPVGKFHQLSRRQSSAPGSCLAAERAWRDLAGLMLGGGCRSGAALSQQGREIEIAAHLQRRDSRCLASIAAFIMGRHRCHRLAICRSVGAAQDGNDEEAGTHDQFSVGVELDNGRQMILVPIGSSHPLRFGPSAPN